MSMGHIEKLADKHLAALLEAADHAVARHVSMIPPSEPADASRLRDKLGAIRRLTPAVKQTDAADMVRALRSE